MQVWALIIDTIRETIDKKLFWINLGLSAIVVAAMSSMSFDDQGIEILFGWKRFDDPSFSTSSPMFRPILSQVLSGLFVDYYVGWVGCILGLISTAGIFPNMMEKGAVDCVVARPISRLRIFFAKYLGALFFMAVQSAFFVGLTFVVVGLRWKAWFPGLLWSIPLLILLFSYLYCLCVAFGIWTRSAVASLLLTMAVWLMIISGGQLAYESVHSQLKMKDWTRLKHATAIVKWVLPDTFGMVRVVQRAMDDTPPGEVLDRHLAANPMFTAEEMDYMMEFEERMLERPWYVSVGPSLLFEAVVLLLAAWRFSKKDF